MSEFPIPRTFLGFIDTRVPQRKGYLSRDLRDEQKFTKEGNTGCENSMGKKCDSVQESQGLCKAAHLLQVTSKQFIHPHCPSRLG